MSRTSSYDPVMRDLNDYLDSLDRPEPETERARCTCGRFFSREVDLVVTPKQCPDCKSRYNNLVARSSLYRGIEGYRNTHLAVGSLEPVRRQA
jgi:hypothetical protein